MKMLHIAKSHTYNQRLFTPPMLDALDKLGELTILTRGLRMPADELAARIRDCDILLTGWDATPVPDCIAEDRGSLKYICHLTGEMRLMIKPCHIQAGIPITNWGDAIGPSVAEGAVALLFTVLKGFRPLGKLVEAGFWNSGKLVTQTSLRGLRVGIYGLGAIGREFVEYLQPFGAILSGYDPYLGDDLWPASVRRVGSLNELADGIDALVIHAGLSEETRHSVNAELLAKLPNNGVVINTARGGLIDQEALMAELRSGRLRAGIDVLDSREFGDTLSPNDPARQYPNLVLTCHSSSGSNWPFRDELTDWQKVGVDNLKRFMAGEPLRYVMDMPRYERST